MQDVSIVTKFSSSASHLDAENGRKTIALIEPICDRIEMDKRVAALRGLRGFGPHNHGLHSTNQNPEMTGSDKVQHYNRRSRVKESDRQIADINISHDGDYAVAVCMGFDPPISQIKEKCIVDNGKGLPLHEPQWGDEGWLDLTKPGVDGGVFGLDRSSDELLDETDKST